MQFHSSRRSNFAFPLSSRLHKQHPKHKIWSQRHRDCKHPNSILRKDSDIYSEAPIASDALESLMCNNHFHPLLIQPEVCSLLLRTMCLSISLRRCFCSVGTISVSGQQTPSRVHHNKAEITQMRSHCIWLHWWVTESPQGVESLWEYYSPVSLLKQTLCSARPYRDVRTPR